MRGEKTKLLWENPEYRKHQSAVNIGRKASKETRKNMSQSQMGRICSEETRLKIGKANSREKSPRWKGGRKKASSGYIEVICKEHPNKRSHGYVLEHRLVVEIQLGRYLIPSETVHHINKIKTDNRPENLMVFKDIGSHLSFEAGNEINEKDILFDGSKL